MSAKAAVGWAITEAMPDARYGPTATLLLNGKVLAAGGEGYNNPNRISLATAEQYTPDTGGPKDPDFVVIGFTLTPARPWSKPPSPPR